MQKLDVSQIERKSVVLVVLSFVVSFIIATALLWTPQVILDCDMSVFKAINTMSPADVDGLVSCTLDEDGHYVVIEDDPYIIINGITEPARVVVVRFKAPIEKKTEMVVFRNEGWGFNVAQMTRKTIESGATSTYFVLPNTKYTDIRIDIDIDCQIASVELGNEGLIEKNATNNPFWFVGAFAFATLSAAAVFVLEGKKCVAERVYNSISKNKKMIGKTLILLLFFGMIASVVSAIVCEGLNDIIFLSAKGIYTFAVVAAFVFFLLCGLACIWYYRKNLMQKFEKVFAIMTLIIGFSMIICGPYAHLSWDIDSHYPWALSASYLGDTKITQSDFMIDYVAPDTLIKDTADGNYINMALLSFGYNEVIMSEENASVSLPHLPSGIFIALGRLIGLPFIAIYVLGRIPNLLIYTLFCYLGMKQLKDGKLILAVIALFPTNLLIATNYSYDYWVTCFSIFAMAYYVGILQDTERKATSKDAFIISASFALACLPKLIYFPLLLIPFLMPSKKIEDKKKYYSIVTFLLLVLIVLFLMASLQQTTSEGDLRGGSAVNPSGQLAYVFGDIWNYAGILLRFLFGQYLTFANMENYISHFAYLGVGAGSSIFIVLMFVTCLFDKGASYTKDRTSSWLNRVYAILMYFGGAALMASALYVSFTPVGYETVLGCQARYMIPWLYPLLSIWSMNRIKPIVSKKVLCWIVLIGCYGLLFYDVATIFLPSVACLD